MATATCGALGQFSAEGLEQHMGEKKTLAGQFCENFA
jgi:hypothetical protein